MLASFLGAFPIDDPRYLVFASLDEPQGDAGTHGYRYGGWTAGPVVAQIIDRIGPILGVPRSLPEVGQQLRDRPATPQPSRAPGQEASLALGSALR